MGRGHGRVSPRARRTRGRRPLCPVRREAGRQRGLRLHGQGLESGQRGMSSHIVRTHQQGLQFTGDHIHSLSFVCVNPDFVYQVTTVV